MIFYRLEASPSLAMAVAIRTYFFFDCEVMYSITVRRLSFLCLKNTSPQVDRLEEEEEEGCVLNMFIFLVFKDL